MSEATKKTQTGLGAVGPRVLPVEGTGEGLKIPGAPTANSFWYESISIHTKSLTDRLSALKDGKPDARISVNPAVRINKIMQTYFSEKEKVLRNCSDDGKELKADKYFNYLCLAFLDIMAIIESPDAKNFYTEEQIRDLSQECQRALTFMGTAVKDVDKKFEAYAAENGGVVLAPLSAAAENSSLPRGRSITQPYLNATKSELPPPPSGQETPSGRPMRRSSIPIRSEQLYPAKAKRVTINPPPARPRMETKPGISDPDIQAPVTDVSQTIQAAYETNLPDMVPADDGQDTSMSPPASEEVTEVTREHVGVNTSMLPPPMDEKKFEEEAMARMEAVRRMADREFEGVFVEAYEQYFRDFSEMHAEAASLIHSKETDDVKRAKDVARGEAMVVDLKDLTKDPQEIVDTVFEDAIRKIENHPENYPHFTKYYLERNEFTYRERFTQNAKDVFAERSRIFVEKYLPIILKKMVNPGELKRHLGALKNEIRSYVDSNKPIPDHLTAIVEPMDDIINMEPTVLFEDWPPKLSSALAGLTFLSIGEAMYRSKIPAIAWGLYYYQEEKRELADQIYQPIFDAYLPLCEAYQEELRPEIKQHIEDALTEVMSARSQAVAQAAEQAKAEMKEATVEVGGETDMTAEEFDALFDETPTVVIDKPADTTDAGELDLNVPPLDLTDAGDDEKTGIFTPAKSSPGFQGGLFGSYAGPSRPLAAPHVDLPMSKDPAVAELERTLEDAAERITDPLAALQQLMDEYDAGTEVLISERSVQIAGGEEQLKLTKLPKRPLVEDLPNPALDLMEEDFLKFIQQIIKEKVVQHNGYAVGLSKGDFIFAKDGWIVFQDKETITDEMTDDYGYTVEKKTEVVHCTWYFRPPNMLVPMRKPAGGDKESGKNPLKLDARAFLNKLPRDYIRKLYSMSFANAEGLADPFEGIDEKEPLFLVLPPVVENPPSADEKVEDNVVADGENIVPMLSAKEQYGDMNEADRPTLPSIEKKGKTRSRLKYAIAAAAGAAMAVVGYGGYQAYQQNSTVESGSAVASATSSSNVKDAPKPAESVKVADVKSAEPTPSVINPPVQPPSVPVVAVETLPGKTYVPASVLAAIPSDYTRKVVETGVYTVEPNGLGWGAQLATPFMRLATPKQIAAMNEKMHELNVGLYASSVRKYGNAAAVNAILMDPTNPEYNRVKFLVKKNVMGNPYDWDWKIFSRVTGKSWNVEQAYEYYQTFEKEAFERNMDRHAPGVLHMGAWGGDQVEIYKDGKFMTYVIDIADIIGIDLKPPVAGGVAPKGGGTLVPGAIDPTQNNSPLPNPGAAPKDKDKSGFFNPLVPGNFDSGFGFEKNGNSLELPRFTVNMMPAAKDVEAPSYDVDLSELNENVHTTLAQRDSASHSNDISIDVDLSDFDDNSVDVDLSDLDTKSTQTAFNTTDEFDAEWDNIADSHEKIAASKMADEVDAGWDVIADNHEKAKIASEKQVTKDTLAEIDEAWDTIADAHEINAIDAEWDKIIDEQSYEGKKLVVDVSRKINLQVAKTELAA